jgi:hypothetical protein
MLNDRIVVGPLSRLDPKSETPAGRFRTLLWSC